MDNERFLCGPCPVARGLAHVGDAWSNLILRDAGRGLRRFDEFQKSLGIAPNILARRLKALTDAGMLEKRRYSERPPRDEYVLTERGRDYLPVLHALGAWGARHFGKGEVMRLVDTESGRAIEPVVVDRLSGRPTRELSLRTELP